MIKKEKIMYTKQEINGNRTTAITVGAFYLAAIVTYSVGNGLIQSIVTAPDHLTTVLTNSTQVTIGALLMLINSVIVIGHGVMMFPILKRYNERIPLGYLSARLAEGIILAAGVVFLLLQIPLSREYLQAGTADASYFRALSTLSIQANFYAYQFGMIAVGFAGGMLNSIFYKVNLIPRGLAVWGLIGYVVLLVGSVVEISGYNLQLMHTIPGGLWELFMGVWLIAKGFGSLVFVPPVAKTGSAAELLVP
jgi:hypothetical protein